MSGWRDRWLRSESSFRTVRDASIGESAGPSGPDHNLAIRLFDGRAWVAFVGEIVIAFILMTVILHVSNNSHLHRCAGALVATYITVEAPISGMSMNPARTFASAVAGNHWTAL
jgi:glycerol uptake facilitator-like aquaporin